MSDVNAFEVSIVSSFASHEYILVVSKDHVELIVVQKKLIVYGFKVVSLCSKNKHLQIPVN